jgi:hypothetical protein
MNRYHLFKKSAENIVVRCSKTFHPNPRSRPKDAEGRKPNHVHDDRKEKIVVQRNV